VLSGHLGVLMAITYGSTPRSAIGDLTIPIVVELVSLAKDDNARVVQQHGATDGQVTMIDAPPMSVMPDLFPTTPRADRSDERHADIQPQRDSIRAPTTPSATPPRAMAPPPTKRPAVRRAASEPQKTLPLTTTHVDAQAVTPEAGDSIWSELAGTGTPASQIPSNWKANLLAQLEHQKRYPADAQARREEGTALLSFGIDRDGNVLGYFLARSSGYADLDDEVLAMIQRASPLPPVPPEVHDKIVQLVVPVRFSVR
jgi:periplasmic protein TonB